MKETIREKLAELEHKQWSHWTKYLLLERHDDKDRERWLVQMNTEYNDLSEKEKNSDRKWADKVISIIIREIEERQKVLEKTKDGIDSIRISELNIIKKRFKEIK